MISTDNFLLQVKGLTTAFQTDEGSFKAVNNISFVLKKGEVLGIVGESGSGKSVTSLSIMQLIQAPAGKIIAGEINYNINGELINLLSLPENKKRNYRGKEIAMIFQEPMTSLNPVLTCGYQVAEALILHLKLSKKEAKAKTIALFQKVQLPRPDDIYKSYPHQLSGGQKQRVMIAMAISCNPSVLIADEPTTALDVTVQKTILELLKELQRETNMSIIFITHDLGVIAELANRVMVMYKGKIVEEGDVTEVFQNPAHPYTKGLLACRPLLNTRLSKLPTIPDFMVMHDDGTFTEKSESINEVMAKLSINEQDVHTKREKLYIKKPLLEVENLCMYYPIKSNFFGKVRGEVKAVDNVSFQVFPGETLGLVGESGCGKTTLGRAVLKLVDPTGGKIIFKNKELTKMSEREIRPLRKNMQLIFQDPYSSLNPRITIGSAIMEPMMVHRLHENDKNRKEQVMMLLKKVNLKEEHFHRYPHEFSGGQRQRIGIARALALQPEFIICDESVSALDVSVQAQVLNLLNELKAEFGFTYIFISHDLSVVKFMSDRIMVMNNGKIEEIGDPDEIYRSPKSEYTSRLIDSIPKIKN